MAFQRKYPPKATKANYRKQAAQPTNPQEQGNPAWYVTKAGKVVPVSLIVVVSTQWGERAKVKFRNGDTAFWVDALRVFPSKNQAKKFAESVETEAPGETASDAAE